MGSDLISDYSWVTETTRPTVPAPYRTSAEGMRDLAVASAAFHGAPVSFARRIVRAMHPVRIAERMVRHDATSFGMQFVVLVLAAKVAERI